MRRVSKIEIKSNLLLLYTVFAFRGVTTVPPTVCDDLLPPCSLKMKFSLKKINFFHTQKYIWTAQCILCVDGTKSWIWFGRGMCQENMGEVVVIECICKEFSIRHAIKMIFLSFQIRKLGNLWYRTEISIALVSERPRTLRLSDQAIGTGNVGIGNS